jgi:hypothetical protein
MNTQCASTEYCTAAISQAGSLKGLAGEFGGARAPPTAAGCSPHTVSAAAAAAAVYGRNWCSLDLRRLRAAEKAERR